jgi:hypothetical protein
MNITLITSGSKARSTPACVITRGMTQAITATLLTEGGAAVSTTGVAAWELGITQDFLAATGLLAATAAIEAAANVLTIALNGHTVEMGEFLDGKNTGHGVATLKGRDSGGDVIASYVWQVVLQNVGYDADTEAAHAVDGLFYTAAQVDAKFTAVGDAIPAATEGARGTIALATEEEAAAGVDAGKAITAATLKPLVDAKESVANKTQTIDAADPSADKYTSEAAVVAYVAGLIPDVPDDLSELTDTTGILAGKVDVDGEKVLSDNNYTDADAAKVATVNNATLETLSGADVTVAPWGRYRWSASGVCSITPTGFAATGKEVAYLVITVGIQTTVSFPAGTVIDETRDVIDDAGVYEAYIAVIDNVAYFRVISRPEAA